MLNLTYTKPCEIHGTIRVNKWVSSLGLLIDAEGQLWNVGAIFGDIVCAVRQSELHPYYTDTSGFNDYGFVSQSWPPYKTEVIDQ